MTNNNNNKNKKNNTNKDIVNNHAFALADSFGIDTGNGSVPDPAVATTTALI